MIIHNCDQNSEEWGKLRAGIPSASAFKNLVTSKGVISKSINDYALVLAAEAFSGEPDDTWKGNHHTDRGHELEPQARSAYAILNDGVEITTVGFVTNDAGTLGCSPDGFINDDGILEIKCLSSKEHIKALMYFQKHGKADPKYFQQTQGQKMVCEYKYSDLFFFHPKLPPFTITEYADKSFHVDLMFGIEKVIALRDEALKALENV